MQNSGKYDSDILTKILPASEFFPAEEYHQDYFQKTQSDMNCTIKALVGQNILIQNGQEKIWKTDGMKIIINLQKRS